MKSAKKTVLIAEGDRFAMELERELLERDFAVEFVDDGLAALERARTRRPDLIILEILLSRMDGLQVCRALKSDPATQDIPILIFTSLLARERALQAGADAFLRKPLDPDEFLTTVRRLIQGVSQRDSPPSRNGVVEIERTV